MAGKKSAVEPSFFDRYRYEVLDVLSRAGRTFVQALTAQLTVGAIVGGDVNGMKAALIAATAAGLSVIWRSLETWSREV